MNSFWKGAALTIILLFGFVFVYNLLNQPGTSETEKSVQNQQIEIYKDYLKTQEELSAEYYKKAYEAVNIANEINTKVRHQQERYELLLNRWEKQADKMDKILQKLDN